jgi:hypothetical protein
MPAPVVLKVEFEAEGTELKSMPNTKIINDSTDEVT